MILSARLLLRCTLFAAPVLGLLAVAGAQVSDKINKIDVGVFTPGKPLTIQAELASSAFLQRIEIAYRPFGQNDYSRSEMAVAGNTATATIPLPALLPPFLEYYLILYRSDAAAPETYPLGNAAEHPLRVDLQEAGGSADRWMTVLSPDPDERLKPEDLLISFAIASGDTLVDQGATRVHLDGADISRYAVISDQLYVIKPENLSIQLSSGYHAIRVELFDRQGKSLTNYSWSFSILAEAGVPAAGVSSGWLYNYGVQLETRGEDISGESTPYNRATVTASGLYRQFRINGKLYATNEENDRRQPQDRFFIGAESPWVRIGYGDSYPVFPELVMSGKRVRGLDAKLTLGFFNLDISRGDIVRRVESDTFRTFPADSLASEQKKDSSAHFALYDPSSSPQRWAQFSVGTFDRTITVVRPSFGVENARLGFSYLKSTDDVGSIRYGVRPEENVLLGSDLVIAFDHHNVELGGQAAISATNRDITRGTFSDADIDSIFKSPTYSEDYRSEVRRTRDLVSRLIIVNENLVPLSLKNLSTLAYEGSLGLRYFDNSFRIGYLRHGESFESFGQPFLRTDVKGYNVSDRWRLMDSRMFISAGFERLNDNTAHSKAATTTGTTTNIGLSYFPRTDIPNVTLAYVLASNVNDYIPTDSLSNSLYAVDDRTDRILALLSKTFTLGAQQNASFSVSVSTRDDHTVKNLDTRNTSVSLTDNTIYTIPLQTTVSFAFNSSTFMTGLGSPALETKISYSTLTGSAQYQLLEDRLRLSGSVSPTFGDIRRVVLNAAAQYYFMKNLSAQTQLYLYFNDKLFGNAAPTTDSIWSLLLRLDV